MKPQFYCKESLRRERVRTQQPATLNGIDYLEVVDPQQKILAVHFIHPLPGEINGVPAGPLLAAENFVIEGGVRVTNVHVLQQNGLKVSGRIARVRVDQAGDFSTYTLRLIASAAARQVPPAGFDPQLASVDFSFKAGCPSDFDCKIAVVCPPTPRREPAIDYLAKDYASFRRLMLDRLALLMPDWRERSPADLEIVLVELLAYAADQLSYYQDAVATEAYLGTARQRISLRRHARLLDYSAHDGTNARTWVVLTVTPGSAVDGKILAAGRPLLVRPVGSVASVTQADVGREPLVFETMHDIVLRAAHNRFEFYTWSDSECCLPKGATRATLLDNAGSALAAGDVLIFEELRSPTNGLEADVDLTHRHAVRLTSAIKRTDPLDGTNVVEVEWDGADALPFPLCVKVTVKPVDGIPHVTQISVARGNVVLADEGVTRTDKLVPATVPERGRYRPQLAQRGPVFAEPFDPAKELPRPAARALMQDARSALPAGSRATELGIMMLSDGEEEWRPQRDLLASDRFATDFVVETELDGTASLRFGDGTLGRKPSAGATFTATYRVGCGAAGNIGAEALRCIVAPLPGISQVRNPMAAQGGTAPEALEQIRQFAPFAFRTQERAVTEDDYAEVARRHPEVQQAAAQFRWFGSWWTALITIDRKGGRPVDSAFAEEMRRFLERFRLAGYDLEVRPPIFVPLQVDMLVCVAPGFFSSDVKSSLLDVFSTRDLPSGARGFFHPDNFTFGKPIYLSQIYQHAMAVSGVASVEVTAFQRFGKLPNHELENFVLEPTPLEIVRLDNDPNFPENGTITFELHGGL